MKKEFNKVVSDLRDAVSRNDRVRAEALLDVLLPHLAEEDPDIPQDAFLTALLGVAAENDAPDVARYLIAEGADVNAHQKQKPEERNRKGSFLQQALYYSAGKSAKVLIEAGADLDARDDEGRTPLHYAVTYCTDRSDLIRLMLEKGADMHAADGEGETPYSITTPGMVLRDIFDAHAREEERKKQALLRDIEERRQEEELAKAVRAATVLQRDLPVRPSPFYKKGNRL